MPLHHRAWRGAAAAAAARRWPLLFIAAAVALAATSSSAAAAAAAGAGAPSDTADPPMYTVAAQLKPQLEARAAAADGGAEGGTPEEQRAVLARLDALWERLPSTVQRPFSWSDPANVAAVALSVAVSLTSSVDRQGGASLYVAIFAVLLRFRMRQAVALTSLTVFLGSLAPAVYAFCDPHLTERGVLSLPDMPGALVILPAMYYGLSWGVIVNSLLPEWLLTLLVVGILLFSTAELAVATGRLLAARRKLLVLWDRLRCDLARSRGEPPPPPLLTPAERRARAKAAAAAQKRAKKGAAAAPDAPPPAGAGSLPTAPSSGPGSSLFAAFRGRGTSSLRLSSAKEGGSAVVAAAREDEDGPDLTADCAGGGGGSGSGGGKGAAAAPAAAAAGGAEAADAVPPAERAERAAALARAGATARSLRHLRRAAEQAEAVALIYPAFHVPTVRGALERATERGVRRRWTAGGQHAEEDGGGGDALAFCPEGAAAELLAGEGDGREQDVAAVLARLDPVTGRDALLRGGTAGGGGGGGGLGADEGSSGSADADSAAAGGAAATAAAAAATTTTTTAPSSPPPPPPPRLTAKKLWHLQCKFELLLLLKVVAFHLATEAIRHHVAHPCTQRFWLMLVVTAGGVTIFLGVVVGCYSRRRLWRGPQWLGGREQVIAARRERARRADVEGAGGGGGGGGAGDASAAEDKAGAAAAGSGDKNGDADKAAAASPEDADAATAAAAAKPGCWAKFAQWRRHHSPFCPLPASEAITRLDACNATDGYACWTPARIAAMSFVSFPIGVVTSTAGMAGGPVQAQLLLLLRLKPHVVAGTSRVLLSAFTLGTAVAYAVSGNLQTTYGLVFGLLNLAVAPLGLLLFRRLRLPTFAVLGLSLAMGALAAAVLLARRLVPELALVAAASRGHVVLPPDERFTMARFCHGTY
jgi:uncharacterized membrane protein YfcA